MAIDPQAYLRLASHLLSVASSIDEEAAQRTAIHRLYYGQFLRLRQYLRGMAVRGATNHGTVAAALLGNQATEQAGYDLVELHKLRNICDYDDSRDMSRDFITLALELSNNIDRTMAPPW